MNKYLLIILDKHIDFQCDPYGSINVIPIKSNTHPIEHMLYIESLEKVISSAGKFLEDLRVWNYNSGFYERNIDYKYKDQLHFVKAILYVAQHNFLVVGYNGGQLAIYDFGLNTFVYDRSISSDSEEIVQILYDDVDLCIIVLLYHEKSKLNYIKKFKLFGLEKVLIAVYLEKPISCIFSYFKNEKHHFVMGLEDGIIAVKLLEEIEDSLDSLIPDFYLWGHEAAINQIIYIEDRKTLISCSADTSIIIWDLENQSPKTRLEYHEDSILSICYLGDGALASGGLDRILYISNIDNEEVPISSHEYHMSSIQKIEKTIKNGKLELITSSYDKNIRVATFDPEFKEKLSMRIINGHISTIKAVQVDYANQQMVTVSTDKSIKFWDFKDMKLLKSIDTNKEHFDGFIILNDDFKTLIKHDSSKKIKFYNTETEQIYFTIEEQTRTKSILNMYDGVSFFVGLDNSEISVYNYFQNEDEIIFKKNKILLHSEEEFGTEIKKKIKVSKLVMIDNEKKIICSGGSDGSLCLFYTMDNKKKYFPPKINSDIVDICTVEISKKVGIIAYVLSNGNLCIFDFFNDLIINKNMLFYVSAVDRLTADLLIISYSNNNKIDLYEISTQQVIRSIEVSYNCVKPICYLRDGHRLVAVNYNASDCNYSIDLIQFTKYLTDINKDEFEF